MQRRFFLGSLVGFSVMGRAVRANEYTPGNIQKKIDKFNLDNDEASAVFRNAKFIEAAASSMIASQLIASYKYLLKASRKTSVSNNSTVYRAVTDALLAVKGAWVDGKHGTAQDLHEAAQKLADNLKEGTLPPPIVLQPEKEDR